MRRALRSADVKTLCPDEDEGPSSVLPRLRDKLGRPVDQESEEEEEYFKEELQLMEGRRHRHSGVDASYEKRQSNKSLRYLREIVNCLFVHKLQACFKMADFGNLFFPERRGRIKVLPEKAGNHKH